MKYCCMQYTVGDLAQCVDQLQEKGLSGLSEEEAKAARRLLKLCEDFINVFDEDV